MYTCEVCRNLTPPGQHRRVHQVLRRVPAPPRFDPVRNINVPTDRTEIAREVPVCERCDLQLKEGVSFDMLVKQRGLAKELIASFEPVAEQPAPPPVVEAKVVHRPVPPPVRSMALMGIPVAVPSALPVERSENFEPIKRKIRGQRSGDRGIKQRKVK